MIYYTKYKTDTGEITSTGVTNVALNNISLESGESVIEGNYNVQEYKIIGGEAVAQTVSIWPGVRALRDNLLSESDWTQLSDSPLTDSKKTEWATYRQTLRDIPSSQSSVTDKSNITWPTEPS
jgi:hypothetical protein|tara:strand:+ start:3361 stop:3729 length:369 start_codon:yes stop_codon:yes gene_type:complete